MSPSSTALHPTGIPGGPYNSAALITPEQAAPDYGSLPVEESVAQGLAKLDSCLTSAVCDYNGEIGSAAPSASDAFVVFGYSQSATISMLEKAKLAAEYAVGEGPSVTFVLIGSGNRPNGGLAAREAPSSAAPTDTQYATVDIALQYDGLSDAPLNPLNLLADLNAYMGMLLLLRQAYGDHSLSDAGIVDQGQYGDTTYYLIPASVLPLLVPIRQLPVIGSVLADILDPPLRVLGGRLRPDDQPWAGHRVGLWVLPCPLVLARNFLVAIPTGWDNGLQDVIGIRPFGTQRPGPYGVGGPQVSYLNSDSADAAAAASTTASQPTSAPVTVGRSRRHISGCVSSSDLAPPSS